MNAPAFLTCCLLVVLGLTGDCPAQSPWNVGTARVKITPEKPLWMSGYAARTQPAEGTLHDLWAKALVLDASAGGRAVVIATDLAGFPKLLADQICADLQARCGLERSRIMLTSSHTHCGPVLEGDAYEVYVMDAGQPALITEYCVLSADVRGSKHSHVGGAW